MSQSRPRHWLSIRWIASLPSFSSVLAIGAVLCLSGIDIVSVLALSLGLVLVAIGVRQLNPLGGQRLLEDAPGFVLVASVMALATGVVNFGFGLAVAVLLVGGAIVWRLKHSGIHLAVANTELGPNALAVTNQTMWLSTILTLLGWQSLGFFAVGLIAQHLLWRRAEGGLRSGLLLLFPVAGFVLSYSFIPRYTGQFWVSVDQLWRSTVAAGVSTWGPADFSGAVGGVLRYHWLGETAGGVIARITGISAVDSTTKMIPVLATLAAFTALRQIGSQLGFLPSVCSLGSAATMLLCREFDVFSPGSLWGIVLFLTGITFLNHQVSRHLEGESVYILSLVSAGIFLPLITLTQSTLGPVYLLVSLLTACWAAWKSRRGYGEWLVLVVGQATLLIVLRFTLLNSTRSDMYFPSISLTSVLQFRGIELYYGESALIAVVISILFLLVVAQKGAGLLLLRRSISNDPRFLITVVATTTSSLLLANFVSLGGVEAHQSRFLSPLVIVITLVSSFVLADELLQDANQVERRRFVLRATVFSLVLIGALWISSQIYLSSWSIQRSAGIAIMIAGSQLLLLGVAWLRFKSGTSRHSRSQVTALVLSGIVIFASGRTLSQLIDFQRTASETTRALEFTGGTTAQDCFTKIRLDTPKDTIIASNWFRTPTDSRSPKNFMVSAWTERRVFLDGPEYVSYWVDAPRGQSDPDSNWVDYRYQTTDNFAERATKESYEALRAANVDYFIIETYMPMPATWEPFAEVILEREPCKVLKLRT